MAVTSDGQVVHKPCAAARTGARGSVVAALVLALVALLAAEVHAGCCRVIRVDAQTPTGTVRVCAPDGSGGCGTVLFEGALALGDAQNACVAGQTVVYQEYNTTLNAYAPPVQAVCNGTDVEL
jgi:hypothetical protein